MAGERPIHLVGSVPLPSAAAVFECVAAHLGPALVRCPDGETGERRTPFPRRPSLVAAVTRTSGLVHAEDWHVGGMTFPLYGLAPGARPDELELGPLGFAEAAKASFGDFEQLQAAGRIPPATRFQVCLPTPFMLAFCFTTPAELPVLWPVYERVLIREMREVAASVPPGRLAIQWDMSPEFHEVLEGRNAAVAPHIARAALVAAVARVTNAVPADVEVGWHFCYGDTGQYETDHETFHVVEPRDTGNMVDFANDVVAATARPIDWVHMPVPRGRDDDAYFAPLARLRLKPGMRLFLGLVHQHDGVEGASRRGAAAGRHHRNFGIATECGMGRRPPERIPALLDLHAEIARTI